MQAAENLPDHGLLIGGKEFADASRSDEPVVVYFGAEGVVERKSDHFRLLGGEAFVECGYEGFRGSRAFGGGGSGCQAGGSQGGSLQELSSGEMIAIGTRHRSPPLPRIYLI